MAGWQGGAIGLHPGGDLMRKPEGRARHAAADRLAELVAVYQKLEADYKAKPELMQGMAGSPDGAAFTVLASILLNLDEAVVK